VAEWQKIFNDFSGSWDMCFGCGQENPFGLKLVFKPVGDDTARAEYTPPDRFQGWPGVLHGGIIANILDEAASWAFNFNGMLVVTAKIEILYRSPALIGNPLIITSKITSRNGKRGEALSRITTKEGDLVAEAKSLHVAIKSERRFKNNLALIWDMDGVIVDTAYYHFKSWQFAFKQRGVDFSESDFVSKFGQRNDAIIRSIMQREVPIEEIEKIAGIKEEFFQKTIRGNVKPLPGSVELIRELNGHNYKMAVASSAPIENIKLLLEELGIIQCFQQLVSGNEVSVSKPSPQIFLLAAQKLGIPPEKCIVFEDAIAGIEAAIKAGMHCIAVTSTNSRDKLKSADLILDTLSSVTISSLEQLVGK
jgi:beta-phosphoglucomutase family hydrolase